MPVLDYRNDVFVFECEYGERALPKEARFFFHRVQRKWITTSAKCAARLMSYATDKARMRIIDRLGKFGSSTTLARSDNSRPKTGRGYRYNM